MILTLQTPPKFEEEEMKYMIILNAAIPLATNLFTLSIWGVYRLLRLVTPQGTGLNNFARAGLAKLE